MKSISAALILATFCFLNFAQAQNAEIQRWQSDAEKDAQVSAFFLGHAAIDPSKDMTFRFEER